MSSILGGSIGVAAGICLLPTVVWAIFLIDWLGGQTGWWPVTTDSEDESIVPLVMIALGAYGVFIGLLGALAVRGFSNFFRLNATSVACAAWALALILPTAYAMLLLLTD